MPSHTPLKPALIHFLEAGVAAVDDDAADRQLGQHEDQLAAGPIASPTDLWAKARYLQITGGLDPALIPQVALDTLVAGVETLFPAVAGEPAAR